MILNLFYKCHASGSLCGLKLICGTSALEAVMGNGSLLLHMHMGQCDTVVMKGLERRNKIKWYPEVLGFQQV